ncbi:TPA: hypothetical protein ACSHSI_004711 [Serratia marcescens]
MLFSASKLARETSKFAPTPGATSTFSSSPRLTCASISACASRTW